MRLGVLTSSGAIVLAPNLDRHVALLAVAQHRERHRLAGVERGDPTREVLRLPDRLPLDRDDGVAALEAGLVGRRACKVVGCS